MAHTEQFLLIERYITNAQTVLKDYNNLGTAKVYLRLVLSEVESLLKQLELTKE